MKQSAPSDITQLLQAAHEGDTASFDRLVSVVYDELYRLARQVLGARSDLTQLNTTALVHEAYVRLLPSRTHDWADRIHFFRVAARAMRQVIVRAARDKMAKKRGAGAVHVTLSEGVYMNPVPLEQVVDLDEALERLHVMLPRQAHVVECRFFAGLNVEETAEALNVSTATVKRDWRTARAWLLKELQQ